MKKILTAMLLVCAWATAEVPPVVAIRNAKIVTGQRPGDCQRHRGFSKWLD
jgi:hypothetical protein